MFCTVKSHLLHKTDNFLNRITNKTAKYQITLTYRYEINCSSYVTYTAYTWFLYVKMQYCASTQNVPLYHT